MLTRSEILDYLSMHKEEFSKRFGIVKLGIFGSFAKEEASESSDIDLLVTFEENTSDIHGKKIELIADVMGRFGREVDVCSEQYIRPYAREAILGSAIYV